MDITIRKILPHDTEQYYELRRTAFIDEPILFIESLEEFECRSLDDVRCQIEELSENKGSFLLGAFKKPNNLVGIIGFRREKSKRLDHIGFIWGLYVVSTARGLGLGKKLILETLRLANQIPGLEQVKLQMEAGNRTAKKLYESFGFEVWGTEPKAVKVDGVYYDDLHMILKQVL